MSDTMATSADGHSIPKTVFVYDEESSKILVPMDVTHVRVASMRKIADGAFEVREELMIVELSEGLEVIGEHAFASCPRLKQVLSLPSTLKVIGNGAFASCGCLETVQFPDGLREIGEYAFAECTLFKRLVINSADNLSIAAEAFSGCSNLISVDVAEGIQAIGSGCFQHCYSLIYVRIVSSVLKKIGGQAFWDCSTLKSVEVVGGPMLTMIEPRTFYRCIGLTRLRIPPSVNSIEQAALTSCTRLVSLELPEGLETIFLEEWNAPGESAIYNCECLVNLVVPRGQRMGGTTCYFSNGLDLVAKSQHRFDDLPIHMLCYYQSYYPVSETLENLQQILLEGASMNAVDFMGMTPFHILALSQTPNVRLLEALLEACDGVEALSAVDRNSQTPLFYLFDNPKPASAAAIELLTKRLSVRRIQLLGLARWRSFFTLTRNDALGADWSSKERKIREFLVDLGMYERMENLSLLELALWKMAVNEQKEAREEKKRLDASDRVSDLNKHEYLADRGGCRFTSGAELIISNVLSFLPPILDKRDLGRI